MMFDCTAIADRARIPRDQLDRPVAIMRAEFPDDETMAELHILRAILAVDQGMATLDHVLRQEVAG
jgi:hypothetical protein